MQKDAEKSITERLAALEYQFDNESIDAYEREHAFFGYWSTRLRLERGLSHESLERVLSYPDWQYSIGDIIAQLCRQDSLSNEDLEWLLEGVPRLLPQNQFAYEQLLALKHVRDRDMIWKEKLASALDCRADWAIRRIIPSIPPDQREEARNIVQNSKRPRRTRNALCEELKSQEVIKSPPE